MPLKKRIQKTTALVAVFFFVFQTLAIPSLYASDAGPADMHGGTPVGNTDPVPENGNPENPGDPDNNDCSAGKPVSLLTGEETHTKTDLAIPGRGLDLTVIHTYKSQRNFNGRWGYGWFLNYDIKIKKLENDNLLLVGGTGTKEEYVRNSAGGYDSPAGLHDTLTENPDGTYTRRLRNGVTYNFNVNGCLSFIEGRNGNRITFDYDSAGKLPINGRSEFFVTQETGVIAYDYKLTTISDSSGRELAFAYDGDGRLTKITDPGNREVVYEYDADNNLVRAYDPADPSTPLAARDFYAYAYDGNHNLVSITNPNGIRHLVNEYDDQDRVVRQTHNGETSVFSYDPANHTASLTRADGSVIAYELSECCGNPTKVVRDAGGLNLTRTYTYDDDMNMTSETDPRGNTTVYAYDTRGNVISVTDAEGGVTQFEYEPTYNQVTKITDALNRETNLAYDGRGNLTRITDALGNQTHFAYNPANGDLLTVTNAGGHATRFAYDAYGQISTITDALSNTVGMAYDVLGNLTSVTDQNSRTTGFSYTVKNQLRQITDALGNVTGFTYDRNGNRRTITDALDNAATFGYDANDRLVSVTNALSHAIAFGYDIHGNLTTVRDAEGNTTTYQYDTWDRLVRVVDAMNRATGYAYDANGNLTAITDAKGNTTAYQYDRLNRVTRTMFPDASFEVRTYDREGNLVSKTNRNGRTISHAYDALNRLRTITYPGNIQVSYAYDSLSRLVSATNSTNTAQYAYDALNRVSGVTQDGRTVGYQYDAAGNRTRLTYPDGSFVTYVHDALNRLDQIRNNAGQVIADYAYDTASRRTGTNFLNGTQAAYAYDAANRLTTLTNREGASQVISNYAYGYDRAGNRTSMTKNGGFHSYAYDRVYQVTGADYPTGWPFADTAFNYDTVGNRTTAGTTTYTANALNQYTTVGTATCSYDGNGNLTGDGTSAYSYDDENRLVRATTASETVTFAYDAFGRRTRKTNASGAVSYVYDGDQVIAEYGASGNLLRKFVYGTGIDEPIAMDSGGNRYFYHFDGLGSVTEMTNSGGTVVEKYEYDVYGKLGITDGSDNVLAQSSIGNPYYFTGRSYDFDTGLYYYRARYYSTELGRFLQVDPVGYWDSTNLYAYVLNNPSNMIDPFGLVTSRCARGLGNRYTPAMKPTGNLLRHDYLVVNENVLSFQAGSNMVWSQGFIDDDEDITNEKCEIISFDPKFDEAVLMAVNEIGAPNYNVWAYPVNLTYWMGARNCQTWADDVLDRAEEIYNEELRKITRERIKRDREIGLERIRRQKRLY